MSFPAPESLPILFVLPAPYLGSWLRDSPRRSCSISELSWNSLPTSHQSPSPISKPPLCLCFIPNALLQVFPTSHLDCGIISELASCCVSSFLSPSLPSITNAVPTQSDPTAHLQVSHCSALKAWGWLPIHSRPQDAAHHPSLPSQSHPTCLSRAFLGSSIILS